LQNLIFQEFNLWSNSTGTATLPKHDAAATISMVDCLFNNTLSLAASNDKMNMNDELERTQKQSWGILTLSHQECRVIF
jgi:hypothetical protein